jgi:hypothetical protein
MEMCLMTQVRILAQTATIAQSVILRETAGLTHEDTLRQPPFGGNCLNWVLGHIVTGRDDILRLLGQSPLWTQDDYDRCKRGSVPITRPDQALPLERLLRDLAITHERILASLRDMADEQLSVPSGDGVTVGQNLAILLWHEGYHSGQLDLLRRLAGKDDKVI